MLKLLSFLGSFFSFAKWAGMGLVALYRKLRRRKEQHDVDQNTEDVIKDVNEGKVDDINSHFGF